MWSKVTGRFPFQLLLNRGVGEGTTPFPGLLHFTLDTYIIILNIKPGGIKYHFLSLWYDDVGLNPGLLNHWQTLYPLGSAETVIGWPRYSRNVTKWAYFST